MGDQFQSTLSMRRATRFDAAAGGDGAGISIHALHEESDLRGRAGRRGGDAISIHALHEESDSGVVQDAAGVGFQSTLSMRRATQTERSGSVEILFQSTLSMRRATW